MVSRSRRIGCWATYCTNSAVRPTAATSSNSSPFSSRTCTPWLRHSSRALSATVVSTAPGSEDERPRATSTASAAASCSATPRSPSRPSSSVSRSSGVIRAPYAFTRPAGHCALTFGRAAMARGPQLGREGAGLSSVSPMAVVLDPTILLLQLGILLAVAYLLGRLAERIGLPAATGELATGLLLGPSVLGSVAAAQGSAWLFTPATGQDEFLRGIAAFCGVLLVGVAGATVDVGFVRAKVRTVALIGVGRLVLPLLSTVAFALAADPRLRGPEATTATFAVVRGTGAVGQRGAGDRQDLRRPPRPAPRPEPAVAQRGGARRRHRLDRAVDHRRRRAPPERRRRGESRPAISVSRWGRSSCWS